MTMPPILKTAALPFIAEVFGPTFQGEGPSCGQRAGFIRLGKCNLSCGWCDTPYTWDWSRYTPSEEMHAIHPEDLAQRVGEMDVSLVVITGGEPLIQQPAVSDIIEALGPGYRVEIETNGTVVPQSHLLRYHPRFNVSPKLRNSEVVYSKRFKPRALAALAQADSVFKFVCVSPADLAEIDEFVLTADIPRHRVWVMPEGVTAVMVTRHTQDLADAVLAKGWNLTTRLQVLAWGGERGR